METDNIKTDFNPHLRKILTFIVLTLFCSITNAQESGNEVPALKERLFFGGNFALQFGTITDIEISPMIGLWVLPKLAVAVGPSYTYYKAPVIRRN